MDDKHTYDHVAAIFDFAKEHGYKVQNFTTATRENKKGAYNYVDLSLVVPCEQPRKLVNIINELETELTSAEAQKDEVKNNEV